MSYKSHTYHRTRSWHHISSYIITHHMLRFINMSFICPCPYTSIALISLGILLSFFFKSQIVQKLSNVVKKCLDITKCCERMFPVCFPCSSTSLDCFHIIGFWIFVHCLASVMRELLKTAGVVWEWANQKAPCFVHNQSNTNTNTQIQKLIQIHIHIQSSPSSAACKSNHRFSVSDRQPKKRSLIEHLKIKIASISPYPPQSQGILYPITISRSILCHT